MLNLVKVKIEGVIKWMEENPNIVEPNMREFSDILCQISRQNKKAKEDSLESFSKMFAVRFGNEKCPDRTGTAMWNLLSEMTKAVIVEGVTITPYEEEYLGLLLQIGNFIHQGNSWNNSYIKNVLTEYSKEYDGIFAKAAMEAYDEIIKA